jgi:hypothetical protein
MRVFRRDILTSETDGLAPGRDRAPANAVLSSMRTALLASLVDLWPVTMIVVALGLTLAWTGLLMSLVWWGIEELI